MKKIVRVTSIQDPEPYEVTCINDDIHNWLEVCFRVSAEQANKTEVGDEYIAIVRKRRWYDRFIKG